MLQLTTEQREAFAAKIADELSAHGRALVLYEPGDATHYEFALVRSGGLPVVGLAAGDLDCLRYARTDDWIMADAESRRAMFVNLDVATHPFQVRDRWIDNDWSSAVLAELLTMIAKCDPAPIRHAYPHIFGES